VNICFRDFTSIADRSLDIGIDLPDDSATLHVERFHVANAGGRSNAGNATRVCTGFLFGHNICN